jgi:hypothetical protein
MRNMHSFDYGVYLRQPTGLKHTPPYGYQPCQSREMLARWGEQNIQENEVRRLSTGWKVESS